MDTSSPALLTVYYNSACPVCAAGICYQRARKQGSAVGWVDVASEAAPARELGIDTELLCERLHVRDAAGQLHVGAQAFTLLWPETRGQRWLAWLLRPWHRLTWPLYNIAARALYRWNRRRGHW